MSTTWRALPVLSIASINELRTAVYEAGGSPATWTDEQTLPADATLKSVYVTEIRDAIQRLWNDRGLGLIPNWSSGAEPTEPAPGVPPPLQSSDITDLRNWFNHWEGWGNLRGVHWWKHTSTDLTGIFWNVESVIALTTEPNAQGETFYDVNHVNEIRRYCQAARNHGLVNIVRLDWMKGQAVPRPDEGYDTWTERFNRAVNTLKGVATIFIVGNEPTLERNLPSADYARAFNHIYSSKVADVKYLGAGPGLWTKVGREEDFVWLESVSNAIHKDRLDGWALHTYGSPYLRNAAGNAYCDTATVDCPIGASDTLTGDASFRRYEEFMNSISPRWARKPVYFTETNTQGLSADDQTNGGKPSASYVNGWIQSAYEEIRRFNNEKNADRSNWPRILCLCWFVDSDRDPDWVHHSLTKGATDGENYPKLRQARNDFIASDTSTGIVEVESALGPATAELPAGVTRLAPFIG